MKKVASIVILIMMTLVMLTGCSTGKMKYDVNLGYDLNQVKYSDITFNVYHSNTDDHTWKQIASFSCNPMSGHSYDVKLQCNEGVISVELRNNSKTESGNTVSYNGEAEASYVFEVEGFEGFLPGWKSFDIENKEGEQFVRLYPISNDGGTFFNDINLEAVYDSDNVNIDNILITIVMK